MKSAWLAIRSAFLWTVSGIHFFFGVLGFLVLAPFVSRRGLDRLLYTFCRNVVRFTGARFEVEASPGYDPRQVYLIASNHVNVFDPFFVYSAMRTHARGLELASHFRVPVYGAFMRRMGNVPVPDKVTREAMIELAAAVGEVLESGSSLIAFPEGTRTRTGRVGTFRPGVFRWAVQFGVPVVPVTQRGAFTLKNALTGRLSPARVRVKIHDPVEPGDDVEALQERVRAIVESGFDSPPGP